MLSQEASIDTPRTAAQIARRAIALHCTIAVAHGVSKLDITEWLREENLWEELTARELRFLAQQENSEIEICRMVWLVEAEAVLLWGIQKLDRLPPPTKKADTALVVTAVPGLFEATQPFIESASLQSPIILQHEEENLYHIRCAIAQAARNRQPIPHGYDKDVTFFRHYALSWVMGYCGQAWDEVTPDI